MIWDESSFLIQMNIVSNIRLNHKKHKTCHVARLCNHFVYAILI